MKCHYAVLEVDRKADDDEIKKAYRKMALQWHPDKNPDRIQECNEYFALIQQAYDVLSDAHERAWYDRHREAILKGGLDEHYQDSSLNLFPYFTVSCYSGFNDSEKGFYSVYRRVFTDIASEDLEFVEDRSTYEVPTFGCSTSDYEEVVAPFYAHWQSYSTARSFAWLDKYDIRQAPNRQVLRAMEKENRKLRDAARKERADQVRELVTFVRKRDRRVVAYRQLLEERRKEQEAKAQVHRRAQLRDQLKRAEAQSTAQSAEALAEQERHLQLLEASLDEQFGSDSEAATGDGDESAGASADNNDDDESLYCVACEKRFGSPKALVNHQRSRKHRDAIAALREHLDADDHAALFVDAAEPSPPAQSKSKKKRRKEKKAELPSEEGAASLDGASEPSSAAVGELANGVEAVTVVSQDDAAKAKHRPPAADVAQKPSRCDMCGDSFASRSKLFLHLKDSGHATLKGVGATQQTATKSKPRRRAVQ